MHLREIVEHINKYDGFDDSGGFKVYGGTKKGRPRRAFQWKLTEVDRLAFLLLAPGFWELEVRSGYRACLLAVPFSMFFFEKEWVSYAVDREAQAMNQSWMRTNVGGARKHLTEILRMMEALGIKQQVGKLKRMLSCLDTVKVRMQHSMLSFTKKVNEDVFTAMGALGPEGAKKRLIIRLYDALSYHTNLTFENKLEHIQELLFHFQLITAAEHDGTFERVRQIILGRSKVERDRMEEWERRLLDDFGHDYIQRATGILKERIEKGMVPVGVATVLEMAAFYAFGRIWRNKGSDDPSRGEHVTDSMKK